MKFNCFFSCSGSEKPRQRYLSDDEIKAIWPHFDNLRYNPRDILKLVLLTAQRPGEVMAMKWEDIDLDKNIWKQGTTKTDNPHLVPLSPQVRTILENRKKGKDLTNRMMWMKDSEYVFPSKYNTVKGATCGHATSTKDARLKVQDASGITGWTTHDLRRTARTLMSGLNIEHHVRERVLNHAMGGVQGVYDLHDYVNDKRDALNKIADKIDEIIGK